MPDSEHRVVYKAFADFTALYADVAKAKAALAALKREQGANVDRSKEIGQQRELNKVTREHVSAVEADAKAVDRDATSFKGLADAARKTAEEIAKSRKESSSLGSDKPWEPSFSAPAPRRAETGSSLGGTLGSNELWEPPYARAGVPAADRPPPEQLALPVGPRARREAELAAARPALTREAVPMPAALSDRDISALVRELEQQRQRAGQLVNKVDPEHGPTSAQWPTAEKTLFRQLTDSMQAIAHEIDSRGSSSGTDQADAERRRRAAFDTPSSARQSSSSGRRSTSAGSRTDEPYPWDEYFAREAEARRGMPEAAPRSAVPGGYQQRRESSQDASAQRRTSSEDTYQQRRAASENSYEQRRQASQDAFQQRRTASENAFQQRRQASESNYQQRRTASENSFQQRHAGGGRRGDTGEVIDPNLVRESDNALRNHAKAQDEAGKSTTRSTDRSRVYQRAFNDQIGVLKSKRRALQEHAATHDQTGAATQRSIDRSREYVRAVKDMGSARFSVNSSGVTTDLKNASGFLDRFAARIRDAAKESGNFQRKFVSWGDAWRGTMSTLRVDKLSQGIRDAVKDSDGAWSKMVALARAGMKKISNEVTSSGTNIGRKITGIFQYPFRAPAAASGGGGSGGGTGNAISGAASAASSGSGALKAFTAAGDAVSNMLSGMITHLFSFQTLMLAVFVALGPVIAALGALGGAALGAGNIMVSLGGSLLALPGLFAAIATGVGVLVAAFGPLSAAFKAHQAYQQALITASHTQAQTTREQAAAASAQAEAVVTATHNVQQAEQSYKSALKSVADAQYSARKAQQDLNDARREATRNLEDLRDELARASLNEESASLAVQQAEADYRKALADPNATLLDREEALNRVKQAEFDLQDVQKKNARNQQDYQLAQKKGIEGSDQVVAAKKALADANENIVKAQQRVIDAQYELTKAQYELNKARAPQAKQISQTQTALDSYRDAMAKLSPSTKIVAEALFGLSDKWKGLQRTVGEDLFGPVAKDINRLPALFGIVSNLLTTAATAMGKVAAKGLEMVTSGPWRRDFATLAKGNATILTNLGYAGLSVADAFRNIVLAAEPFATWVSAAIKKVASQFDAWAKTARSSGGIADFLNDTKAKLRIVADIVKNLFGFFAGLYGATKDMGTWLLNSLDRVSAKFAAVGKAQEKQGSGLRKWLQDIKPLLSAIAGFVGAVAGAFATLASDPRNIAEAQRILNVLAKDILPKLVHGFEQLSGNGAISSLLVALGNGLDVINAALDRTKGLPLQIFVWFLQQAGEFLKWAFENKAVGDVLVALAVGMALFVGASAFGKLTGLFKIWEFLRFLLNNKGALTSGILDKIFGNEPGTRAGKKAGDAYNKETGKAKGTAFGTYTRQIDTIIGLLKGIEECVCRCNKGGAAPAGEAESGASLKGSAAALDGSAGRLDAAAEALLGAAAALRGAAVAEAVGGLAGGSRGAVRAIEGGATRAVEGRAARAVEGGAVRAIEGGAGRAARGGVDAGEVLLTQEKTWWQKLFGRPASADAPFVAGKGGGGGLGSKLGGLLSRGGAKEGEGLAARLGGKLAGALDPLTWAGLGIGLASDTGLLGKKGSTSKQLGQAGGAVLTGAGVGGSIGALFGGVGAIPGAAIGATIGGVYSLAKDKGLRDKVGDLGKNVGGKVVGLGKDVGGWADKDLLKPVEKFFTGLGRSIGRAASGAVRWVYDHLLTPAGHFFSSIGKAIGKAVSGPVKWVWDHFLRPILAIFLGIQAAAVYYAGVAAKWVYQHLLVPIGHFFAGIGSAIAGGVVNGPKWFYQQVLTPVGHFFAAIGSAIGAAIGTGAKWFYQYVLTPVGHFFAAIGSAIGSGIAAGAKWFYEYILTPVGRFFSFIGSSIGSGIASGAKWFYQNVLTPMGRFFSYIGSAIGSGIATAGKWAYDHLITPVGRFFSAIGSFLVNLPSAIEQWAESIPGIGKFIKGAFNLLPGAKHDSGGLVQGTYDGRPDTRNTWLTVGEHVTRKRVVDKPGAKQVLAALNDEHIEPQQLLAALAGLGTGKTSGRWMDPSALYGALGAVTVPVATPRPTAHPVTATHVTHDNSKHTGLTTGNITIHNPVRETSSRSLRRTLHASAYMLNNR